MKIEKYLENDEITALCRTNIPPKPGADLGLILTDFLNQGPREQASRGALGNFFGFLKSLKFPLSGFCLMSGNWKKKTFVQTIFQISTWKVLLLLFYY